MLSWGGSACTAEEARTIEAIWARRAHGDNVAQNRANREIEQAVQAFIRGDQVRGPGYSGGGCSG